MSTEFYLLPLFVNCTVKNNKYKKEFKYYPSADALFNKCKRNTMYSYVEIVDSNGIIMDKHKKKHKTYQPHPMIRRSNKRRNNYARKSDFEIIEDWDKRCGDKDRQFDEWDKYNEDRQMERWENSQKRQAERCALFGIDIEDRQAKKWVKAGDIYKHIYDYL